MRLRMVDHFHLVHLPVAAHAAHAAVHMHRMVEVDVVWRLVNLHPLDRLASLPGIPHQLQLRILTLDLRMAVHTNLGRRNVRIRRGLHVRVAVTTIHPQLAGVDLM